MIEIPKGKSEDWYDGYLLGMEQARELVREAHDEVWEAILDAQEVASDVAEE